MHKFQKVHFQVKKVPCHSTIYHLALNFGKLEVYWRWSIKEVGKSSLLRNWMKPTLSQGIPPQKSLQNLVQNEYMTEVDKNLSHFKRGLVLSPCMSTHTHTHTNYGYQTSKKQQHILQVLHHNANIDIWHAAYHESGIGPIFFHYCPHSQCFSLSLRWHV